MSNEAKFTKGPWFAHMDNQFFNEVGPKETIQTFVNVHANKILDMSQEECDANTNLIAAAPEMYEMLNSARKELCALIDEVNDQRASRITSTTETEPDYHDQETLYLIDKLLAKARGE